ELQRAGQRLAGIRLDSGDLAALSKLARALLDEGGFADAAIVASNDLDEGIITSLKAQGATIAVWGVGTKLVTAYDQPALGGVYKLGAIQNESGEWERKLKLSEQAIKTSTPGILQVRRFFNSEGAIADMIYDELNPQPVSDIVVDPLDPTRRRLLSRDLKAEDLLLPVVREGKVVRENETLTEIRQRVQQQLSQFHNGVRRHTAPHQYPVGLEQDLHEFKTAEILRARHPHPT
ncbi:MAG: nicotinate phosphoribosyltransferase, partial [Planctomycetaceae bacterium]|nr:nicotinate phosphoribosyltransferase [Planctomycetaceae bacterium]